MDKKPYYISTAIAYTSAKPHIGNTYEIVLADAIARYKRLTGYDAVSYTHLLLRVNLFVVDLYLKMQVRTGRIARVAGKRDPVALGDHVPDRYQQLGIMPV